MRRRAAVGYMNKPAKSEDMRTAPDRRPDPVGCRSVHCKSVNSKPIFATKTKLEYGEWRNEDGDPLYVDCRVVTGGCDPYPCPCPCPCGRRRAPGWAAVDRSPLPPPPAAACRELLCCCWQPRWGLAAVLPFSASAPMLASVQVILVASIQVILVSCLESS